MEKPELARTATPRTDAFIAAQPPLRLPAAMAKDPDIILQIRELMIAWSTFARELEQDLNDSVPREWNR